MTAPLHKINNNENHEVDNKTNKEVKNYTQHPVDDLKPQQNASSVFEEEQEEDELDNNGSSSVQVAVRVRPFLPSEAEASSCIETKSGNQTIRIGGNEGPIFTFDHTLPESTSQKDVYSACVVPLVQACLRGYNATVLAYGQTGSGKTHTIVGPSIQEEIYALNDEDSNFSTSASSGVIPRALKDLFHHLSSKKAKLCATQNHTQTQQQPYEYEVRVQFLELYGEEINDTVDYIVNSSIAKN